MLKMADFTKAETCALIALYEENDLLWDTRRPDYHNREKRAQAMRTLSAALKKTGKYCILNV